MQVVDAVSGKAKVSGHWIAIVTVDCESVLCEARSELL